MLYGSCGRVYQWRSGHLLDYTLHDLRRLCIKNRAKELPTHRVQQVAGHSDIQTSRRFYLPMQPAEVAEA